MAGFNVSLIPAITGIVKNALIQFTPNFGAFTIGAALGPKSAGAQARVYFYGDPGAAAAYDAATNNYETATDADFDGKDVTLGQPIKKTKRITAQMLDNGLTIQMLVDNMTRRCLLDVATAAYGVVTAANFPTVLHTGVSTTLTADKMGTYSAVNAAQAGWDPANLHAVLSSAYYGNVLTDDDFKTLGGPAAEEMVRTGIAQDIYGWKFYNAPNMPGNSQNLVGFVTDGSGILIGSAENANAPGVKEILWMHETVKAPNGLILTVRGHSKAGTNEAYLTVECLCGFAVGRAAGLNRIISA